MSVAFAPQSVHNSIQSPRLAFTVIVIFYHPVPLVCNCHHVRFRLFTLIVLMFTGAMPQCLHIPFALDVRRTSNARACSRVPHRRVTVSTSSRSAVGAPSACWAGPQPAGW